MTTSEKILFGSAAAVIGAFSALGFYLIEGEPAIKSLVVTGHNHILSFAYGAILFGLLLKAVNPGGVAQNRFVRLDGVHLFRPAGAHLRRFYRKYIFSARNQPDF